MLISQVLAKEKARNLKGKQESSAPLKDHAPGWNENLAVSSYQATGHLQYCAEKYGGVTRPLARLAERGTGE